MAHLSVTEMGARRWLFDLRIPWQAVALTALGIFGFVLAAWFPWWGLVMYAPQYPQGLTMLADLQGMTGDVAEINQLNHYIGLMRVDEAAQLERAIAPAMVGLSAVAAAVALLLGRPWPAWLSRLPLILFPAVFLADLKVWLWYAGNHLDPRAALSSSIKSFTPTLLGAGQIAQFRTFGWVEVGFWLALAGGLLVLAGGWLQIRRRQGEV